MISIQFHQLESEILTIAVEPVIRETSPDLKCDSLLLPF
jgi:hypothetical protein